MPSSNEPRNFQPVWWSVQHTVVWEQSLPALRRDFERRAAERRRDQIKHQGADDPVFQDRPVTPRNVDVDHAHAVADDDWEVATEWDQIEPAVRYGVGARAQYAHHEGWNEELEQNLRRDWSEKNEPSSWDKIKRAVRRGFEFVNKDPK
jgi:hypothetical protein